MNKWKQIYYRIILENIWKSETRFMPEFLIILDFILNSKMMQTKKNKHNKSVLGVISVIKIKAHMVNFTRA